MAYHAGEPRILNADARYPRPELAAPTTLGYLYVGASVAPGLLPFVLPSARRRRVLHTVKALAADLAAVDDVLDVRVFRAIVIPPTASFSRFLKARRGAIPPAKFDVIKLVRTASVETARRIEAGAVFKALVEVLRREARSVHVMAARNVRRIADVDVDREGLFLFNHFAATDPDVMLKLWDHLAGWYVANTGRRNSVAMAPLEGERADYAIVNWARWDFPPLAHFAGMLARPSFWRFVTKNLDENDAASMPVYCRLA